MKIKSDPLLHLKTKCGKVNLSCFCILQKRISTAPVRRKITRFLKENDPKRIFISGQYDPWTAAGVTWLKGKKNIHVFVQPKGSHMARIHTLPQKEKEEAIGLIKKWLEE